MPDYVYMRQSYFSTDLQFGGKRRLFRRVRQRGAIWRMQEPARMMKMERRRDVSAPILRCMREEMSILYGDGDSRTIL